MTSSPAPVPAARRGRPHPARRARRAAGWLAASAACLLAVGMGVSARLGDAGDPTSTATTAADQTTASADRGSSTVDASATTSSEDRSSLTGAGAATGSSDTGSSSAQTTSSGSAA
jgi:hypothetical protein